MKKLLIASLIAVMATGCNIQKKTTYDYNFVNDGFKTIEVNDNTVVEIEVKPITVKKIVED